jgi:hypothetical protein
MLTLGILCVFLGFVIGIMFLMALAARDRSRDHEDEQNQGDEPGPRDGGQN